MNTRMLLASVLLLPFFTLADDHNASAPVETWNCSLNEGQTMEAVVNISKAVGAWSKSKGFNDGQWIFTPSSGDMSDQGRFILMTGWASWEEMGTALQGFFGDGEGTRIFADFNEAATCETRNFWTVINTYNHGTQ
jgi:hypothetical protein